MYSATEKVPLGKKKLFLQENIICLIWINQCYSKTLHFLGTSRTTEHASVQIHSLVMLKEHQLFLVPLEVVSSSTFLVPLESSLYVCNHIWE